MGGEVRLLISGGAPLSQEVKEFLFAAFSCPILESYGVSENSGAVTSTSVWETRAGIVGGPIAGIKMKLRDLPELGYLTTDNPPRGEVCVKGNSVFKGYFRNPALTQKVLDPEGWLSLGDVGVLLPGGCLKLIDRVSSICKLQHGFYVAPSYLENIFGQCQVVSQVFVSADPRSEFVAAIIVPEREYLLRKLSEVASSQEHYQNLTPADYQALLDSD